jgi:hypothetical protein
MVSINLDKVRYIVAKAHELDVKVAPEELDDGSSMERILEDHADDPTLFELKSFLTAQSDDELRQLLALIWIGRGDFTAEEWPDVMRQVRDVREQHTVDYLIGTPMLGDFLEEGLAAFGLSCN